MKNMYNKMLKTVAAKGSLIINERIRNQSWKFIDTIKNLFDNFGISFNFCRTNDCR